MKSLRLSVAGLASAVAAVAFGGADVVEVPVELSNPGFEEGKAGWNFLPNMSVSTDRPHGGKACALVDQTKVNSDGVYLTRQVPVDAGAEYGAECFIRTEDVKADDRIRQGSCGATISAALRSSTSRSERRGHGCRRGCDFILLKTAHN